MAKRWIKRLLRWSFLLGALFTLASFISSLLTQSQNKNTKDKQQNQNQKRIDRPVFESSVFYNFSPIASISHDNNLMTSYNTLPTVNTSMEEYLRKQHDLRMLVNECVKGESTTIPWNREGVRHEVDMSFVDPIAVISYAAGLIDLEQVQKVDPRSLEKQLKAMANLKIESNITGIELLNAILQTGLPTSESLRSNPHIQCYPVVIDIPWNTRGFGMCTDAAFYAVALKGALVNGKEYKLWDILCPDTIHITLESFDAWSISWTRPSWSMLNIEQSFLPYSERAIWQSDIFLSKTLDAHTTVTAFLKDRGRHAISLHLGMSSLDLSLLLPSPLPKKIWRQFAHIRGKSPHKHTDVILEIWKQIPWLPRLEFISKDRWPTERHDHIKAYYGTITTEKVANIAYTSGIHLCVSEREGFGHYINEARSVGAVIISTDHPPMNELVTRDNGILVPVDFTNRVSDQMFGEFRDMEAKMKPSVAFQAIKHVLKLSIKKLEKMGQASRDMYLKGFWSFFNTTQHLTRPHLLHPVSTPLPKTFPFIRPRHLPPFKTTFWFQSSATSFTPAPIRNPIADKWILMWPSMTSSYRGIILSGRVIRSPSRTGTAVRFEGDACIRLEKAASVGVVAGESKGGSENEGFAGVAVRFSGRGVVYHEGGLYDGVDVGVLDGKVFISVRRRDRGVWYCDGGVADVSVVYGIIVYFDDGQLNVSINRHDISETCDMVEKFAGDSNEDRLGFGVSPKSMGCIIGSLPQFEKGRLTRVLRDGDAGFSGFVFDVLRWSDTDVRDVAGSIWALWES